MLSYSKEEMDRNTFAFIYGCALRDAILQKAFKGKKDWVEEVTAAQAPVQTYVELVLKGEFKKDDENTKRDHDAAFLKAATDVCDIINKSKPTYAEDSFSFGNAQKLINIVIKHIYAHTYSLGMIGKKNIRTYFRFCHCPMDSIMLSRVWKDYKIVSGKSLGQRKQALGNDFLKAWGNEDFDLQNEEKVLPQRYKRYQTAIEKIIKKNGDQIFPIEYDYIVWKK